MICTTKNQHGFGTRFLESPLIKFILFSYFIFLFHSFILCFIFHILFHINLLNVSPIPTQPGGFCHELSDNGEVGLSIVGHAYCVFNSGLGSLLYPVGVLTTTVVLLSLVLY